MKKVFLNETERRIPVSSTFDVAVIGGGVAGVAAAVAAARNGVSVCIIEKENALGGLATLGNVTIFLPLCDGMGNQVSKGLAEELLKLSVKDTPSSIPECWLKPDSFKKEDRIKKRYQCKFNPTSYMLELEAFVICNRIKIFYDSRFCSVVKTNSRIDAVVIENKSGRSAVACKAVVDATGDADVCYAAGEKVFSCSTNVPAGWFDYFDGETIKTEMFSMKYNPRGLPPQSNIKSFAGDNGEDVTAFTLETHRHMKTKISEIKKKVPDFSLVYMNVIPAYRMTRRLVGEYVLEEADMGKIFNDSTGILAGGSPKIFYHLPFRSLIGCKNDNLITAGRCISSSGVAWDITRLIPGCAVSGQAAGIAASLLSSSSEKSFKALDFLELKELLFKQKVF